MQTATTTPQPDAAFRLAAARPAPLTFEDLDIDARAALRAYGRTMNFTRGQAIPLSSRGVSLVWFVLSGTCRAVVAGEDGKQLVLGIAAAGDVVADSGIADPVGEVTRMELVAEEQVQLLGCTDADACRLAERFPQVGRLLLDAARTHAARMQHLAHAIAYRSVERRLAGLLLELGCRHGHPTLDGQLAIGPLLTQADLAMMIGVSRKAIVGALGQLRDRQLVGYRRNRLVLLDQDGLRSVAAPGLDEAHATA